MKRIINGITYNTDVASLVATWTFQDDLGYRVEAGLGQTPAGNFFVGYYSQRPNVEPTLQPITIDEVRKVIATKPGVAIVDKTAIELAVEGRDKTHAINVRLPDSVKFQLDQAAQVAGKSVHAFVVDAVKLSIAATLKQPPAPSFGSLGPFGDPPAVSNRLASVPPQPRGLLGSLAPQYEGGLLGAVAVEAETTTKVTGVAAAGFAHRGLGNRLRSGGVADAPPPPNRGLGRRS